MYSILKATTWEFVRRGWLWILTATMAIVGMVALRSWALSLVGRSVEEWAKDPEGRCLILPIGFVASALAGAWMLGGAEVTNVAGAIIAGSIGAISIVPFGFFGSRVRRARKELKEMKAARLKRQLER